MVAVCVPTAGFKGEAPPGMARVGRFAEHALKRREAALGAADVGQALATIVAWWRVPEG